MSARVRAACVAALLTASDAAWAHGSAKGLGNFFGGVAHPLIEPTHLVALIALGLCIGQRGIEETDPATGCCALGTACGLALAGFGWTPDTEPLLLSLALLTGMLVAAAAPLPRWLVATLAALIAGAIALGSRPEGASGSALAAALLGAGVGVNLWTINVAVLVGLLRRPWLRVVVRVAGSWVAACSVLVLALSLVGQPPPAAAPRDAGVVLDTGR